MAVFCKCTERRKKKRKTKRFSEYLKALISEMAKPIFFKVYMQSPFIDWHIQNEFCVASFNGHRGTKKSKFAHFFSCKYVQVACMPHILGPHNTLPCILIMI